METPDLTGTWLVTEIDGEPVLDTAQPEVTFADDGRIHGRATINRIVGSYTLEGDSLELSPLATTMMAGPQELMDQEARFLKAMAGALRVSFQDNGSLDLISAGHSVRLVRNASAGGGAQSP